MTGCGCIATVLHFVYFLTVRSHKHYSNKALEVLGNRGTRACISGGQGNTCIKMRGTGTKAILGNREHRKQDFWFGGTGEQSNLFRGEKGTGTPRKGLNINLMILVNIEMKLCKCCTVYWIMHIYCNGSLKVFQSSSLQMKVCEFCINCYL